MRAILLAAVWLVLAATTAAAQPSWCKYARSESERTICATPSLWEIDACEDRLFRAVREADIAARKKIDAEEKAFAAERDRCARDTACIARRYAERAAKLDAPGRAACVELATAAAATSTKGKAPSSGRCGVAQGLDAIAPQVRIGSITATDVAHGGSIEVTWQLPAADATPHRVYLIAAMPDGVRFAGHYQFDEYKSLAGGPGFVALPGGAKAPYGVMFGEGQTRVVIPVHDEKVARSGRLTVKPYIAGPLAMSWAVVGVAPGCGDGKAHEIAVKPIGTLGPYTVATGQPTIVVQDFTPPHPRLAVATAIGTQHLLEVELSMDGRYRLEIFERRYRVFDRTTGAKVADRSGVKARFSPGGRFVVASVGDATAMYPTNFEVFDLLAERVVATATGPIIGWSNGDTVMLDGGRAYQALGIFNTLVDPLSTEDGVNGNWPTFFPGCGTCDAWIGSNFLFDWDSLTVLRGEEETPLIGFATLASGQMVDLGALDTPAAARAVVRRTFGRADLKVATGWSSTAGLQLTHVGRGYEGYTDDNASLTPADKRRPDQLRFVTKRRLAVAEGRVLAPDDLKLLASARGETRSAWSGIRNAGGPPRVDAGYVADELAKFDLLLLSAIPTDELPIPAPPDSDHLVRAWPEDLKGEVSALHPPYADWLKKQPDDLQEKVIVAAWRLELGSDGYLLLQHGEPAMTVNGAHDLKFDLLATSGPRRGDVHTITDIGGLFSQFVGREHTVARVFVGDGKRLLVALPGAGKAAIVDPAKSFATRIIDLMEPTLLCGLLEVPARGLLVQSNCDGQMFIYDPGRSATPILAGRVHDEELILYTPEGYYASTYEGAHFIHVAFPGRPGVHSFEQFAKVLERPDVIRAALDATRRPAEQPRLQPPPVVEATTVSDAADHASIEVTARANGELQTLELYEDGQIVDRRSVDGSSVRVVLRSTGRAHVRRATVVASDRLGFRSRPVTVDIGLRAQTKSNALHVVAVGVDVYTHFDRLHGARLDAETLVRTLGSQSPYYGKVQSVLRVDRVATPATVARDLENAVHAAGPDDTILFFYAGHGARSDDGRFFMTTTGSDPDRLAETAIDWQTITDVLGRARGRVLVVIDACHSGETGRTTTNDEAVSSLAATTAPMVILAASKGRQLSEELPGRGGGIFTQTLARLLGSGRADADIDQDGLLAISEIYGGVKQTVETQTEGRQTPWLVRRNIVGDAPLF